MARKSEPVDLVFIGVVALLVLAGGGAAGVIVANLTRGWRNNNPGNIRLSSIQWEGQAPQQTDGTFVQFENGPAGYVKPAYGFRAMGRILDSYAAEGHGGSVASIINRWAPPSENNTSSYVDAVASSVGVAPDAPIDLAAHKAAIVSAIAMHENGTQPYSPAEIQAALDIA